MQAKYGDVTVSDETTGGDPRIFFPGKVMLTVEEAEAFWSELMSAIMHVREANGDPV